jgi:hypothetical protein
VVAFASSLSPENFPIPYDLMKRYVLPAAAAGKGAAADPAGDAAFASLAAAAAPRESPRRPLPAMASAISGARFRCEGNPLGMESFSLDFAAPGLVRVTIESAGEEEPLRFEASLGGKLAVGLGGGRGMAARAEWKGERILSILAFDMRARMDFDLDFDGSGGAAVRVRSPAYGIDAAWKAAASGE